jgi:hypothetical protein
VIEPLLHHLKVFAALPHKGCCGVSEGMEREPGWAAEPKQPREVLPHLPRWEYAAFLLGEDEVAVRVQGADAQLFLLLPSLVALIWRAAPALERMLRPLPPFGVSNA